MEILILGGGATCFSFGTFWSSSYVLRRRDTQQDTRSWMLLRADSKTPVRSDAIHGQKAAHLNGSGVSAKDPQPRRIPRISIKSASDFSAIRARAQPIVLDGLDIGPCTDLWTNDYLKAHVGPDRRVAIHDSKSPNMNFQTKNFSYATRTFKQLVDSASDGEHVYLRALSAEKPADKPTHLVEDFPTIAADFRLPPELQYVIDHAHSSPLRISGPVTMWLHYDVMANVLCQIRGSKRLLLYPPSDVVHLSFPAGASSSTIEPFGIAAAENPGQLMAHPHEACLEPGDVLFIPPLWLHAAEPTDGVSVAVNVFFKDDSMEAAYAAGKDVYGNRNIAAYERGRRDIQRIEKSFDGLPQQVKSFYLGRLAAELQAMSIEQ